MGMQLRNWIDGKAEPVWWDSIMFVSSEMDKEFNLELKFDGSREDTDDQQQMFLYLPHASAGNMLESIIRTVYNPELDQDERAIRFMKFVLDNALHEAGYVRK